MKQPVDVALIGLGGFGGVHRQALEELQGEGTARLVAVAEVNQSRMAETVAALRSQGVVVYEHWEEMLERGGFDAVAIAAPLHLHREMTIAALERGYPVFCEKSAAVTVQDVAAMAATAARCGLPCAIDFQWLSSSNIRRMKQLVTDGVLGEIKRVIGVGLWKRPDLYYQRTFWAGKFRIGSAYAFDGPLYNALAHMLNNCLYLASPEPGRLLRSERVRGEMYRAIPLTEMEDTATLHAVGERGTEVLYFATYCHSVQLQHYYRLEGSRAELVLQDDVLTLVRDGKEEVVGQQREDGSTTSMYRNFVAALAGREPLLSPVAESLKLVRTQNGAYASSGRIHAVPVQYVRRYPAGDSTATEILGLGESCRKAARQGQLLSDLAVPWAVATPWVQIAELQEYVPASPAALGL